LLKSRDPNSGVRDFEAVNRLAASHGLELLRNIMMPSNNRILVWSEKDSSQPNTADNRAAIHCPVGRYSTLPKDGSLE
jgi:hypothetical protein